VRATEVHSFNLGREEECFVRFLFGLLQIDGCVDLMLTGISSKRENKYVYRKISIRVNDGCGYSKIDSSRIAKISVEFIFGNRVSADFLLTFSYYYLGPRNKRIRLADDQYLLSLRNNDGLIVLELKPWHGLFRTSPKAVLRMLLWEAGLLE